MKFLFQRGMAIEKRIMAVSEMMVVAPCVRMRIRFCGGGLGRGGRMVFSLS